MNVRVWGPDSFLCPLHSLSRKIHPLALAMTLTRPGRKKPLVSTTWCQMVHRFRGASCVVSRHDK